MKLRDALNDPTSLELLRVQAIYRDGCEFIPVELCPMMVAACSQANIAILGVERFLLRPSETLPAWEEFRSQCTKKADAFFSSLLSDEARFFDFVLKGDASVEAASP